eukprot:SM000053S17498  [mRNA]  locus=s53:634233:635335:- [translate_table: standard]
MSEEVRAHREEGLASQPQKECTMMDHSVVTSEEPQIRQTRRSGSPNGGKGCEKPARKELTRFEGAKLRAKQRLRGLKKKWLCHRGQGLPKRIDKVRRGQITSKAATAGPEENMAERGRMDHSVVTSEEPHIRQTSCRKTIPLTKAGGLSESTASTQMHGTDKRIRNTCAHEPAALKSAGSPRLRDTARRASLANRSSQWDPRAPCPSTARGTNSSAAGWSASTKGPEEAMSERGRMDHSVVTSEEP